MSRVLIRAPRPDDEDAFLAGIRRSRALHKPWIAPPASSSVFRSWLLRAERPSYLSYLICLRGTGELVGVVNLSEIVRGAFQSAYLDYYAFVPHHRSGLMTEGLSLVVAAAFRKLRLHRLEANIQPANKASLALVRRVGFQKEGLSPRYLRIRGRWRDHERWAVLKEGWKARR
jgi:ribosomal-protein-alanine N-acetyltransferase